MSSFQVHPTNHPVGYAATPPREGNFGITFITSKFKSPIHLVIFPQYWLFGSPQEALLQNVRITNLFQTTGISSQAKTLCRGGSCAFLLFFKKRNSLLNSPPWEGWLAKPDGVVL